MGEAQAEYQKTARIAMEEFAKTKAGYLLPAFTEYWFQAATAQWYHGDSARARQELQSRLNRVDDNIIGQEEDSVRSLLACKKFMLERLGDFVLFSGAASERNRERFANGIARYEEATRVPTLNSHDTTIRWKQAILLMLNGELDRAETLMRDNHKSRNPDLICQLAEAVLFYYQQGENASRDEKLRTFQRQFTSPGNVLSPEATQPVMMDLRLFCGEFLIHDSIKREDWKTLADDILTIRSGTGTFLRQYPGALPFMRRFNELLVRSAVLLHDHAELPREQQRHMDSIIWLLERMRLPASVSVEGESPTLIYFFLPESNRPEEGFVICFPQDGRSGTFYPLSLTRQMVLQGVAVPPLDEKLLEQIKSETRMRVSWDDTASWARGDDALTEANYPYGDVLPLQ